MSNFEIDIFVQKVIDIYNIMGKKEKILNVVNRNGGYITTKELTKYNINRRFLTSLVKEKNLLEHLEVTIFFQMFFLMISILFFQNVRKLFFRMLLLFIFIIFLIEYL